MGLLIIWLPALLWFVWALILFGWMLLDRPGVVSLCFESLADRIKQH